MAVEEDSKAIEFLPEPVLFEDVIETKLSLPPMEIARVPRIILERINSTENFSILCGKHTKLEKYDMKNEVAHEAEENSDDDCLRAIPNQKEERVNHVEYSVNVAVDEVNNGIAGETEVAKTVFTVNVETNTGEKLMNAESMFHPDVSSGFAGASALPPDDICVKSEEIEDHQRISYESVVQIDDLKNDVSSCLKVVKNENNEGHFVFSTDGEIVSLKTEEVICDDDLPTEAELCAKDSLLASCLATSGRKKGLRRLERRSYRNQYACDQCVMKFRFLKELKCHVKEHSSSNGNPMVLNLPGQPKHNKRKKYDCSVCPQLFQSAKDLVVHSEEHQLTVPLLQTVKQECPGLRKDASINLHIKAFCCIECPRKFKEAKDLYKHSKQHKHNFNSAVKKPELQNSIEKTSLKLNPTRSVYCCSDCPQKFRRFKDLLEHSGAHKVSDAEVSLANQELKQSVLMKEVRVNLGRKVDVNKFNDFRNNVFFMEVKREKISDDDTACSVQSSQWHCCIDCPLKFQTLHGLHRHSVIHGERNGVNKEKTNKKNCTRRKSHFEITGLPGTVYSCAHCPCKSMYKKVIERHLQLHFNNEPFTCKLCSRQFRELRSFRRHASVHNADKPFSCTLCPAKIKYWRSYKDHMHKHSLENSVKQQSINQNVTNNISSILRDPMKALTAPCRNRARKDEEKPFPCNLCMSRFTQNADLQRHFRHIHSKSREYRCELCHRIFYQESTLQRHLQAHADENRFVCMVCPASFNEKRKLKYHLNSHFRGDCFTCSNCSKRFRDKNKLQAHLAAKSCQLQCTLEKKFKCPKCPAKFNIKSSVTRHLNSYHPENKFTCSICSTEFQKKLFLKRHLRLKNCVQIAANRNPTTETLIPLKTPNVTMSNDSKPITESEALFKSPQDRNATTEWTPDFIEEAGEPKFMLVNSKVPNIKINAVPEIEKMSTSKCMLSGVTETAAHVSNITTDLKEIISIPGLKSDATENELCNMETVSDAKCAEWIILNYADESAMVDVQN